LIIDGTWFTEDGHRYKNVNRAVTVDLADLIDNDLEGVLDLVSERAIGSVLLQNIDLTPTSINTDQTIQMRITGYIDEEDLDEEE
jgi:hypothetical protein